MNVSELNRAEKSVYNEAKQMLSEGTTAADFSSRFFAQGGALSKLSAKVGERKALVASELYKWLKERLNELRQKEASSFESEVQRASGRLTIMVARSLHAALKEEALFEGVSLSELIRLKLSIPYKTTARLHLSERKTKTTSRV